MAGHSKWNNIQHRKGAQDAKRSKIFTKLIREITVAAKMGDPNPEFNPRLRHVIDKALAANMTKDRIDHAIKKGSGEIEGVNYEQITYEGHGPFGVALVIECLTDNKNRTVSDIRHALNKKGGSLGTSGSAAYLFNKKGYLLIEVTEDQALELSVDFPIEDIEPQGEHTLIITPPDDTLIKLKTIIKAKGYEIIDCDFDLQPTTYLDLSGDQQQTTLSLIEQLEDLDDVQNVHANIKLNE